MRAGSLSALAGFALALAGAARAVEGAAPPGACLSSGAAQETVGGHQVVTPARAIFQARQAVPNADILRASLCRESDVLVYRITMLRKDGRVVRVTVDAPSGKVTTVH